MIFHEQRSIALYQEVSIILKILARQSMNENIILPRGLKVLVVLRREKGALNFLGCTILFPQGH